MDIEHLVKMANQIGDFFAAYPDRDQAEVEVASHLERFWAPRMRSAIRAHLRDHEGAGLNALARAAVQRLRD